MNEAPLTFRRAQREDLATLVGLLAADPLGAQRERAEDPLPQPYLEAFEAISADPNQELTVACVGPRILGVLQLTFIPSLTYQGSWRAQIEGVRVAEAARSQGLGGRLVQWAVDRARSRRCRLVQLTTDRRRPRALAFYEALGFQATHDGMKLLLDPADTGS